MSVAALLVTTTGPRVFVRSGGAELTSVQELWNQLQSGREWPRAEPGGTTLELGGMAKRDSRLHEFSQNMGTKQREHLQFEFLALMCIFFRGKIRGKICNIKTRCITFPGKDVPWESPSCGLPG